ncbi:MAG: alpha/beta hydrolase fold domain-containing protein [Lachnospiraceae bacterium]|nr:alpha/beta hydrolase fold domain-containing protein [Lachnospiraceae bacterium]
MTKRCVPLEPAAEIVCNQSAVPPLIFQLPPKQGREKLEEAQTTPVYKYPAVIHAENINTGIWGKIPVYFVLPQEETRNVIFYIHGGGWVFGSFYTHEKLIRELSARTNSLVVFPEYTRSPEAKYPTAIEQCYFVLSHLWDLDQTNACRAAMDASVFWINRKNTPGKPYSFPGALAYAVRKTSLNVVNSPK